MCQWKHILLLQRNQNVQRHPNLGPPDRPLLVPESLTSLTKDVLQAYEMEGGDLLPSTQMIPPSIIQQTPLQHGVRIITKVGIMRLSCFKEGLSILLT